MLTTGAKRSALSATFPRPCSGQVRKTSRLLTPARWRPWPVRGEQAERLRALAAKHETTLAKLLVRMMEVFEAQEK